MLYTKLQRINQILSKSIAKRKDEEIDKLSSKSKLTIRKEK